VGRLAKESGEALTHLLGISREAKGKRWVDERRQLAADVYGQNAGSFKKSPEPEFLEQLADSLLVIESEIPPCEEAAANTVPSSKGIPTEPLVSQPEIDAIFDSAGLNPVPAALTQPRHRKTTYGLIATAAVLIVSALWLIAALDLFSKTIIYVQGIPPFPGTKHATAPSTSTSSSVACPQDQPGGVPTKGPELSLLLNVAAPSYLCWTQDISPVTPGTRLKYVIDYTNTSRSDQGPVAVRADLASGIEIVPATTKTYDGNHPHGTVVGNNDVTRNGITLGYYAPGAVAYVSFYATAPNSPTAACGWTHLSTRSVAWVGTGKGIFSNAVVDVFRPC
jgi:hypothetical protein